MEQTSVLLQAAYKTAKMGSQAISTILPKIENKEMKDILLSQLSRYDDLADRSSAELIKLGEKAKEHMLAEAMADLMVQLKASMNPDPSKHAEMLINGATMGVIELYRAKNASPSAAPISHTIATDLNALVLDTVERMKSFL